MKKNMLLENLSREMSKELSTRRYSLADMISESYKVLYQCEEGTNLKKLAESHLEDVRSNPKDIDRLSRHLALMKELVKMEESNQLKDEDLVDKKEFDTVEPKKERVIQSECNETTRSRDKINQESIKEADAPDLTEEELEELAKHLETIRKEKKNAPKTEMKEDAEPAAPVRRGIKCHLTDAKNPEKEEIQEERKVKVDIYVDDEFYRTKEFDDMKTAQKWADQFNYDADFGETASDPYIDEAKNPEKEELKEENSMRVVQIGLDIMINPAEDMNNLCNIISDAVGESTGYDVVGCMPSDTSWSLEEYGIKESKSYAGLSNFKKQSESKAFYKTFKKMNDVLKEGKALTRQESIDLYKASNSALTQLSIELEHNPEFLDTFKESVTLLSKDVTSLLESLTRGKAPSKKTMKSLAKFSEALLRESLSLEDAVEDSYNHFVWDLGRTPYADDILHDITDNYDGYEDAEATPESGRQFYDQILNILRDKGLEIKESKKVNEAEKDEEDPEEAPEVEETPEEDFVGDDEGAIDHEPSEEEEEYDQEYADGREELNQELSDEFEETDDEFVQSKLETDRVEVAVLKGEDPDEAAAEEEAPEESEEDETSEESTEEDDEEITDDELAELKKHLTEMRAAKKLKESEEVDLLSSVKNALDDAGIRYSARGRKGDMLVVARKDLERASAIRNEIDPEYTVTVCTPA